MTTKSKMFVQRAASMARYMPVAEATDYLRGLIDLIDGEPEAESIRSIAIRLNEANIEFEALNGQMALDLKNTH